MKLNRAPYRLPRFALFGFLALMLIARVGPICEAVAVAAVPSASGMDACEGSRQSTPDKKIPAASCSMPCAVALDGVRLARVAPLPFTAIAPWPVRHAGLLGLAGEPATPPPRTV